ncbi:DUF2971 domain-containing protein [Klebsiella pneumoniae]|uniref:DUF2971 domain-containing protein n=1 Tax=Klebsiella pneumoniae TaxID=573 RepID=UPI001CBEB8A5|nr:DUF2971 domain-containing protein [Klebsiella pneumoniae]EKX7637458.1 DUF2971 domain-containing protein [Klebsiella pneumoniae]ELA1308043.1 DUF2971 domain-containing protein [Klebsiella pneumoniae]MBZ1696854.1 DUF2971 domain-containing protein [Klebsiella pneumoniae]HDZ2531262.1 DUF2971 domain-containing protein [Klebsiella pneumoniae]HDZ2539734.1 DUF2971 domain-containing protein [Klebsiella pneumoniae]
MEAPSLLYKYTNSDNALLSIKNQKFKWSSIQEFNDPFESRFLINPAKRNCIRFLAISISISKTLFDADVLENTLAKGHGGISLSDVTSIAVINKEINNICNKHSNESTEDFYNDLEIFVNNKIVPTPFFNSALSIYLKFADLCRNRISETFGVLCLSAIKNNFLMWSHYANNHKGVMFEFDSTLLKSDVSDLTPKKVKYQKEYPELTYDAIKGLNATLFPKQKKDFFETVALTKQDAWSYEAEYRSIISIKDNQRLINVPQNCIKSITLGCAMPKETEIKIIEAARNELPDTKIFKNKLNDSSYTLDREAINL